MAENPTVNTPNSFYQAPLEVPGYVNQSIAPIPSQPINLYGLLGVIPKKISTKAKTPYEQMMEGGDPYAGLIPDVAPLQTNLATLEPLDDPAGIFHSQDGFGKYGFSSILNNGDNEDRYSQNFRQDNPDLFFRPGFHPWEGLKKIGYWGGGFLEKTLESAAIKTGQGIGAIFGMTLGNVAGAITGEDYSDLNDWLSKSTDNILSNMFNTWDQNLKQRYHYFQEKSDRENKGFIQSLGDGDFWMNDVSDGLGFLVSSMLEAGLVSKASLGTKLASRIAPLASGVESTAIGGQAAGTLGGRLLGSIGGAKTFANAVDVVTQTMVLTAIESATEAKEVQDSIYETFNGKINPETGMYYTDDERKRLASAAAGEVFKQNMTVLIGPKMLETLAFNTIGKYAKGLYNKSFGQATTEAGKASGSVRSRIGGLTRGTSYNKTSALSNMLKIGSAAGLGFVSEGLFEENIQLAISRDATDIFGGGDEYYRPGTTDKDIERMKIEDNLFGETGRKYLKQTSQFFKGAFDDRYVDDELSKSIGIGGLFGITGGAFAASSKVRQQAKIDKFWNDRINRSTTNLFESNNFYQKRIEEQPDPENPGKTKPVEVIVTDPTTGQPVLDRDKLDAFLNSMNNIQGLMDIIVNTEDTTDENNKLPHNQELNKLARNVLFTQLAMDYIRAGKKDLLLANLKSAAGFSDEDVQALGYIPGMMSEAEKNYRVQQMRNIVEKLDKANQWIENNVLDNVSEKRQGKFGLAYSRAQARKRQQEFEAKKAYLRGLAMQNSLLDRYLDDIDESEVDLPTLPTPEQAKILSSVLDEEGQEILDVNVPLSSVQTWNKRIPALRNQIAILEKEYAYYIDNIERDVQLAAGDFDVQDRPSNLGLMRADFYQAKADEALERINSLDEELENLRSDRDRWMGRNKRAYQIVEENGNEFVVAMDNPQLSLEDTENERLRRLNDVKREEIGIQKGWIDEEWRLTAALKEEKTKQDREDTYFSRRMTLSRNAYNQYFQREVLTRDTSPGKRRLILFDKDESKRVTAKQYKANEQKLMKAVRIQGKAQTIFAKVNGQKLISEINALLERDLPSEEFAIELKRIIDLYNGKPMVISEDDKTLVDEQISDTQDEYNFVRNIYEYMPSDDRFNDKYYDINSNNRYIVKPEYDTLQEQAAIALALDNRIEDLQKIRKFLQSIPETLPGDWNNTNAVKKRIADVYTETADNIINNYNNLSNNGQSEISGDSLSTKQELESIDFEIDELGQLKVIFESRDKNDAILATPEFQGFIADIDRRIADLERIRDIVKERLNSRLRENQDFLIDTVSNLVEQVGLNIEGHIKNEPLKDVISEVVDTELYTKLQDSLQDLNNLINKEEQDSDDKKAIADFYWTLSGQVAAIQEVIKVRNLNKVSDEIKKQKKEQITKLEDTNLMKTLKSTSYYDEILNNIDNSLLGTLQMIFYQTKFSHVNIAGNTSTTFLDDQPSSPVYKFREDYNLRKLIRNIEKDNSRTPETGTISKEDLLEFLQVAKDIQLLEDLDGGLQSTLNLLDEIEREKEVVQAKIAKKDNQYENLIIPSTQQLFFIRKIAQFLRTNKGVEGFKNWIFIQAPGGAGKTQTLGTWFNTISGIPRDRILATAFTEEASKGIKKALLVGEEGPKDANEMASYIAELIRNKQFDHDVLIIDEFPAINIDTQKALYDQILEYSKAKQKAGKGEFKVVTMGDTNQLTFTEDGSLIPRPAIIVNPKYFGKDVHPASMTIIPSLTVNFRSNLFAITSFVDQFKGSSQDLVNAELDVLSTDPDLNSKNVKGVVSLSKSDFPTRIVNYLKNNTESPRTRALIVNEDKIDSYKKLLQDNGITVITDPNNEVTKGVYVTSVKNSQGFSFDEVFIDLESKDKLFTNTSVPSYLYNKGMYVAASRARNLIVVTNFPNLQNIVDDSIADLENKALTELQTKDTDFINQRDLEINGAKTMVGSEYAKMVVSATPVASTGKTETVLDEEDDEEIEEEEEEEIEEHIEEETGEEKPAEDATEEVDEETDVDNGVDDESSPNEVLMTEDIEDDSQDEEITTEQDNESRWDKVRNTTAKAFNKLKDGVVDLLFPTGTVVKFKIGDGQFSIKPTEGAEYSPIKDGDEVSVIPFNPSKVGNSKRNYGYAVVAPARDESGDIIPNNYRTIAILSDSEIDKFKNNPALSNLYNAILDNEKRTRGFISIEYTDVSDPNGFVTTPSKVINELQKGRVAHANPIKYRFGKDYSNVLMDDDKEDPILTNFIDNFYENYLNSFPESQRQAERNKIRDFYMIPDNYQIIIPAKKDVESNLRIPLELQGYVRAGRPYILFKSYFEKSSWQYLGLSRKYLNSSIHGETTNPIKEFIGTAKAIRSLLVSKGINGKLGYSKSTSNFLSRVANTYIRNSQDNDFTIPYTTNVDGKRVTRDIKLTHIEAERIYNFFSLYSVPSNKVIKAQTEQEIINLTRYKRSRNYTFEDGETIYGKINSYDPKTKTFQVTNTRTGEESTKSGVISHSEKSYVGKAQQALDDIFNSNGHISKNFISTATRSGFVTDKERFNTRGNRSYKFMALLGSKQVPVVKTYNQDKTPKEYYEDVIDILEDLFNFGTQGELSGKTKQYVNEEGNIQDIEMKFRVPVALTYRNEGQLEYSYAYSPQNTSRQNVIYNKSFFESNLEEIQPTKIYIDFSDVEEQVPIEQEEKVDQPTEEQKPKESEEQQSAPIETLTKQDINTLSFQEIQNRLTEKQKDLIDTYAKKEGFDGYDHFFKELYSSHPEEQAEFRDYLIECLL